MLANSGSSSSAPRRIGLTGPGGFIGRQLLPHLLEADHCVRALSRRVSPMVTAQPEMARLQSGFLDLARPDGVSPDAFAGLDAVIHLAGQAHADLAHDPEAARQVHEINVQGTLRVAEAARDAGVRRFVFVSSATVHGPTSGGKRVREDSPFAPADPYAESKLEAEAALRRLAGDGSLDLCIVRPPLVYGPHAKGNFRRLLDWAARGRPVPSAARANRRSVVGLSNLCSFLELAATRPAAAGETFLVSDGVDLATGDLYALACEAFGQTPRFLPVARPVLAAGLRAIGRGRDVDRLLGDLRLDTEKATTRLKWQPRLAPADEVARAVAALRESEAA